MKHGLKRHVTVALVGALAVPQVAHAGGFYLQEQSVKGAGRAFSGEVADQGAESLWWNPAAIGGVSGVDSHFAISAILPKGSIDNVNTLIVRPGQTPDRTTAAYAGSAAQTPILVNGGVNDAHAVVLSLGGRLTF